MIAALALNSSILFGLILIPLVYPEALPRMAMAFLMQTPPAPPPEPPPPVHPTLRTASAATNIFEGQVLMPRVIPQTIGIPSAPEPAALSNLAAWDGATGTPGGFREAFRASGRQELSIHLKQKARRESPRP